MSRRRENKCASWADAELVAAFKQDHPGAYDEVYRRYRCRVESVCRRFLGDRDDANDATQETFLRAFRSLGRITGDCRVPAWLTVIATNVCLDEARRRRRRVVAVCLTDSHPVSVPSEPGIDDLLAKETPAARALSTMRPLHAHALRLAYLLGFSHREVALHLQISPDQAKALLYRSRQSFKEAWAIESATWAQA